MNEVQQTLVILVFAMIMLFVLGFFVGQIVEDRRICSAWYKTIFNKTIYQGLVLDNLTVLNSTNFTTKR